MVCTCSALIFVKKEKMKEIKKEIINALKINSHVDWDSAELTPNEEFKELTKLVRKLFKEY